MILFAHVSGSWTVELPIIAPKPTRYAKETAMCTCCPVTIYSWVQVKMEKSDETQMKWRLQVK